jgi:MoaA/NifB/PqqE/SkfB family radical SAM enzyme
MPSNYITVDTINHINAELSNYCNAACPMCARFDSEQNLVKEITNNRHTTLDDIRDKIGTTVIKNLKMFRSCGNVGDGTMNPECYDIYEFVKKTNPKTTLTLNTNGGARNPEFFREMAKLGVVITFSIDGLEDTNHLYRRNVKWDKVMSNVKSFIDAGGIAIWDYLIFKHNEHQIGTAEAMSNQLGFVSFNRKTTTRWNDFDKDGNWLQREKISVDDYELEKPSDEGNQKYAIERDYKQKKVVEKKVICNSFANKNVEIFLHANGNVSPCCWLGDLKIHESKNIIDDYHSVNIHHKNLNEILQGKYFQEIWKGIEGKMQKYRLQTCQQVCGVN